VGGNYGRVLRDENFLRLITPIIRGESQTCWWLHGREGKSETKTVSMFCLSMRAGTGKGEWGGSRKNSEKYSGRDGKRLISGKIIRN